MKHYSKNGTTIGVEINDHPECPQSKIIKIYHVAGPTLSQQELDELQNHIMEAIRRSCREPKIIYSAGNNHQRRRPGPP